DIEYSNPTTLTKNVKCRLTTVVSPANKFMMIEERTDYPDGVTEYPAPKVQVRDPSGNLVTIDYAANVNGPWIEDGGWTSGNYLAVKHGKLSANIGFADGHAGLLSYTNAYNTNVCD